MLHRFMKATRLHSWTSVRGLSLGTSLSCNEILDAEMGNGLTPFVISEYANYFDIPYSTMMKYRLMGQRTYETKVDYLIRRIIVKINIWYLESNIPYVVQFYDNNEFGMNNEDESY